MNKRQLIAGILIVLGVAAAVFTARRHFTSAPMSQAPQVNLKAKGDMLAPVTVEVFSDFECPACRAAVPEIEKILAAHPEKVRVLFFHFPLSAHRFSPLAHQAAECAARQGHFWPYHDKLYAKQSEWTVVASPTELLLEYARDQGMDLDRFAACLTNAEVALSVQEDRRYGDALRVNSTPTFFINGERFVGGVELAKGGAERIEKILGEKKTTG